MKICAVQTKPITGDIQSNIDQHKRIIEHAVSNGADAIVFPELSLTGYEPELAKELATDQEDGRFDGFQNMSDTEQITIGVGVSIKLDVGICIGMIVFQPHQKRHTYSKKYLHADEEPFFVGGQDSKNLIGDKVHVALAICYELSVPEHAEHAFKNGAEIYIASVAKFETGIQCAIERLSEIARTYSMAVFMSNSVGEADGGECAGQTAIWNKQGVLVGQLDDTHEGILVFDTDTEVCVQKMI
ncbi:MAG: carbon-nitrogen hydrolase family protein [Candidatus Latescibacteria bacterium]|jgi:predicted amidohydrolase|nr:carbon-nitrogen hydrolase family protein [Candidatus Latescibacterota bacterium]